MAGELAAEWIKIPDGNGNLQKVWVRDSTARRDIAQLQTDVSGKADAATTLAGYGITDAYTKTQVDGMIPSVPSAYTSNPEMDGTASPGSSTAWARGDHVHPHDSTKADASAIPTKTSDLTNDSGYITLDSTFFGTPTAIPSGADLDTYTTAGHYSAATSTIANSLSNCPATVNFSLFVVWRTSSLKSQIIFTAGTTLFYRYQSSSGWSTWRKISTTAA